jgi:hypothetical protein
MKENGSLQSPKSPFFCFKWDTPIMTISFKAFFKLLNQKHWIYNNFMIGFIVI